MELQFVLDVDQGIRRKLETKLCGLRGGVAERAMRFKAGSKSMGASMSFEDLLVHLDDSKSCASRVDAAIGLAQRYGAHLTGVYVNVEVPLLGHIRAQIPRDLWARMEAEAQALAEAALKDFREAAEKSGIAYGTRTDHALDTTFAEVLRGPPQGTGCREAGESGADDDDTR